MQVHIQSFVFRLVPMMYNSGTDTIVCKYNDNYLFHPRFEGSRSVLSRRPPFYAILRCIGTRLTRCMW